MSSIAIAVIPARYASSRFPGKPLATIAGKSMIQRVYEQVSQVSKLAQVIVATDDERIERHVRSFGGQVRMTGADHQSGTDRCAEVAQLYAEAEIVLNIQGDEPFIQPAQIEQLLACFQQPETQIATLIKSIQDPQELQNTSTPKVVINRQRQALYFSRQCIPYQRDLHERDWLSGANYYKHIGIYGFRRETLMLLTQLPPSPLERSEALEQLRWLENGYAIQTAITEHESYGVDHPGDIEVLLRKFNLNNQL